MNKYGRLSEMLMSKFNISEQESNNFIAEMFKLIEDALKTDKQVKVKGLGSFKLTTVNARESVDVNTGERIVIESREKISFSPDTSLSDLVNSPFAQFETVVLNDGVDFSEIDNYYSKLETDNDNTMLVQELLKEKSNNDVSKYNLNEQEKQSIASSELLTPEEDTREEADILNSIEVEEQVEEIDNSSEVRLNSTEIADSPTVSVSYKLTPCELSALNSDRKKETEKAHTENENTDVEEVFQHETPIPAVSEENDSSLKKSYKNYILLLFSFIAIGIIVFVFLIPFLQKVDTELKEPVIEAKTTIEKEVDSTLIKRQQYIKDSIEHAKMVAYKADSMAKAQEDSINKAHEIAQEEQRKKIEEAKQYDKDVRVRTGAYRIIGVSKTIVVKAGETMSSISKKTLGPDMECYVEAINGKTEVKEGESIKIPLLELKKRHKK
jgi:DNA-binding protein HU